MDCVSPALVISIMEAQQFTAFNLYASEVKYQLFVLISAHKMQIPVRPMSTAHSP